MQVPVAPPLLTPAMRKHSRHYSSTLRVTAQVKGVLGRVSSVSDSYSDKIRFSHQLVHCHPIRRFYRKQWTLKLSKPIYLLMLPASNPDFLSAQKLLSDYRYNLQQWGDFMPSWLTELSVSTHTETNRYTRTSCWQTMEVIYFLGSVKH